MSRTRHHKRGKRFWRDALNMEDREEFKKRWGYDTEYSYIRFGLTFMYPKIYGYYPGFNANYDHDWHVQKKLKLLEIQKKRVQEWRKYETESL